MKTVGAPWNRGGRLSAPLTLGAVVLAIAAFSAWLWIVVLSADALARMLISQ